MEPDLINVAVVYSPAPRQICQWQVRLAVGATVKEALLQTSVFKEFTDLNLETLQLGIWGARCSMQQILKNQDRIEIYRPLRVDPKVARRERFSRQGAKRAGLFATKRAGAKAGYGG